MFAILCLILAVILIILCLGYLAVCLVVTAVAILGWCKNWKWVKWLASITSMSMLAVAMVSIVALVDSYSPASVFERTFEQEPTDKVSEIQSDIFWFADTGSVYLKFKTSKEEFENLLPAHLQITSDEDLKDLDDESHPSWWITDSIRGRLIIYKSDSDTQRENAQFSSEWETMAYDPVTGYAYYHFTGID